MNKTRITTLFLLPAALLAGLFLLVSRPAGMPGGLTPAAVATATAGPATAPLAGAAERTRADRRLGVYWAPVGSRLEFVFRTRTELASTAKDPEHGQRTESQVLNLSGRLVVEVVARRDREAVVAFACPELVPGLPGGTAPAGELAADLDALRARNFARIDVDGRILGYRFADVLSMPQRDYVRGLFGGFGFVVPADAGEGWTANGSDSTGEFTARYDRETTDPEGGAIVVRRTKLRYVAQRDAESMPATLEGEARGTIDARDLGWLRSAVVDDVTRIAVTIAPVEFRVVYHATLELEAATHDPALATDGSFDGTWDPAGGHTEDPAELLAERDRADWTERLRGQSVETLTAAMAELLAAGREDSEELFDLWSSARWLLRLEPEAIAKVSALLAAAEIDPKLASLWLSALADAGSEAAQGAVLATWNDGARSADVRAAAAAAMFDVAEPSAELVQGVADGVAALRTIDGVDATAVLALGALAQRAPELMAGDRTALAAVEGWQEQARRLEAEDLWLDALGNARSPRLEAAAREVLDDPRLHVREAAVRALGRVEGESAFATLRRLGSDDPSPELRAEALGQLANRPEPAARDALLTAAETDGELVVRRAALRAILRSGVQAGDRARLETLARNERDPDLRDMVQRMLRG